MTACPAKVAPGVSRWYGRSDVHRIVKWFLCVWLCVGATVHADDLRDEARLRAALVYNLMLFVEWPDQALNNAAEILLCVVPSHHDTARAFTGLAGQTIKGRTLLVQRRGALAGLGDCNAVYLEGLDPDLLNDKLISLAGQPILTLSSSPDSGAMIALSLAEKRLVFDVSADGLTEAGLSLASRVMQLARSVRR